VWTECGATQEAIGALRDGLTGAAAAAAERDIATAAARAAHAARPSPSNRKSPAKRKSTKQLQAERELVSARAPAVSKFKRQQPRLRDEAEGVGRGAGGSTRGASHHAQS
jgi:hypothetical protein